MVMGFGGVGGHVGDNYCDWGILMYIVNTFFEVFCVVINWIACVRAWLWCYDGMALGVGGVFCF